MEKILLLVAMLSLAMACSSDGEVQSADEQVGYNTYEDGNSLGNELDEGNQGSNAYSEQQGQSNDYQTAEDEGQSEDSYMGGEDFGNYTEENMFGSGEQTFETSNPGQSSGNALATNSAPVVDPASAFSGFEETSVPPALPTDIAQDAVPVLSSLQWLGYDYSEKSVTVELKTRGDARFELYQEINKSQQPELVVRLLDTLLRPRLTKPLVADEFRSPVAHVRTRQNPYENYTDILVTLRDPVKPQLYASGSDIKLTYSIPDRYWGQAPVATAPFSQAELMSDIKPENYAAPVVATPAPVESNVVSEPAFISDPANTVNVEELPNTQDVQNAYDAQGLPRNDFQNPNVAANYQQSNNGKPVVLQGQNIQNQNFEFMNQNANGSTNANAKNVFNNEQGNANSAPNSKENYNQIFNQGQGATQSNNYQNAPANDNNGGEQQYQNQSQPTQQQYNNQQYNEQNQQNDLNFEDSDDFDGEEDSGNDIEKFEVRHEAKDFHFWAVAQANMMDDQGAGNGGRNVFNPANADMVGTDIRALKTDYNGANVDLDFRAAPLADVIRAIANESGINFTMPPAIGAAAVTISLKKVPWDQALKAVLETNGLAMVRLSDNLMRIDQLARLAQETREIRNAQQTAETLAPTKVLIIRLSYATAGTVAATVTSLLNQGISAEAQIRVQVDARTNSLLIEGTASQLAKAKSLVDRIDLRTPQVEIISRIVEVSKTNNDAFGITWTTTGNFDANNGLGFGGLTFPNYVRSRFTVDPGIPSSVGRLGIRMGSINSGIDVTALLAFEETKGTTEVLQSNRVVVQDNQPATVAGGSTDYFVVPNSGTTIVTGGGGGANGGAINAVNFNISLGVTPQISVDGTVQMTVNISSVTPKTTAAQTASIGSSNRNITTTLRNKSGETAVIGGLWDALKEKTVTGIPFVSDLPIIGHLFKTTINKDVKRELLIMLTPRILDAGGQALKSSTSNFSLNTEPNNAQLPVENTTNSYETPNAAINNSQSNTYNNENSGNTFENTEMQQEEPIDATFSQSANYNNSNASQTSNGQYQEYNQGQTQQSENTYQENGQGEVQQNGALEQGNEY